MGIFDFFRKKASAQSTTKEIVNSYAKALKQIADSPLPEPISNDEYQKIRDFEVEWLESHYDFNSIEGINSIPISKDLKRPPTSGVTGEVYYYLRHKAYQHENEGNINLALACLRKSNELLWISKYAGTDKECYALVKMLARAGYIDEAHKEKAAIDRRLSGYSAAIDRTMVQKVISEAAYFKTDLVIMSSHGSACTECAKYQGRVYSLSGRSKLFPKVPDFFYSTGTAHSGCGHTFSAYIHGVNDPMLDYTLSVHPLKDKRYGANIVVFSNRPFVDDRTEEYLAEAAIVQQRKAQEHDMQSNYHDHMIEIEAQRGQEARDFKWLQENIPTKCPKSLSGFRRMKTQNTKNYQALKQLAADLGREI